MKMKLVLATVESIEQETNDILQWIQEEGGMFEGVSPPSHLGNGEMALTIFYTEKEPSNNEATWEGMWKDLRGEVKRKILVCGDIISIYDKAWRTLLGAGKTEIQIENIEGFKEKRDQVRRDEKMLKRIFGYMEMLEENKKDMDAEASEKGGVNG